MTVLTSLLQSVRLVSASLIRIELLGEAVVHFPSTDKVTLHLVLHGDTTVRSQDGAIRRNMAPGQYIFIPAGTVHEAGGNAQQPVSLPPVREDDRTPLFRLGDGPRRCSLLSAELEIDRSRLDAVARIMPEIKRHVPEGAPTIFNLPEMFTIDGLRQMAMIAGGNALLHCAVEAMLVNAVRDRVSTGNAAASFAPQAHTAPVVAALRLMYRHPERDWTLPSLAAACGVSRSVFASTFAQQIGATPIAFLTRIRMMRAETLLQEDRHTLPEVAALTGYRSETAFNRAFSTHAGISPGAWRRAMRRSSEKPKLENGRAQ